MVPHGSAAGLQAISRGRYVVLDDRQVDGIRGQERDLEAARGVREQRREHERGRDGRDQHRAGECSFADTPQLAPPIYRQEI